MRAVHSIQGGLWLGGYLLITLLPLVFVLVSPAPAGRTFWTELSVGLAFVGLAMMCAQFLLIARFSWLKAPFGSDVVYQFHKVMSLVAIALVVAHPVILYIERWDVMRTRHLTAPWPWGLGMLAVVCLLWLVIVSFARKRLGVHYDAWRRAHAILACVAIAAAIGHVLIIDHYLAQPWQKALWLGYSLLWVLLIAYVRVFKPARELRERWEVASITPQRGGAYALRLRAVGDHRLRFRPGQFAWITLFDSPFSDREHPFSFSGSAHGDGSEVEFTIKELGDWTRRVKLATPGTRAFVDGPHGALSADRHADAKAFALFAGGIGITPMISHVRTFRDRGDTRPLVLFYAGKDWGGLTYAPELVEIARGMPSLRVVFVLGTLPSQAELGDTPPANVAFETGFVTPEIIERHAPMLLELARTRNHVECFICGPVPMMHAVERHLAKLGVPLGDYHSERFDFV